MKNEVYVEDYMKYVESSSAGYPEWYEFNISVNDNIKNYIKNYLDDKKISNGVPITGISYNDAVNYSKWLSKKTNYNIVLPSNNQWTYFEQINS